MKNVQTFSIKEAFSWGWQKFKEHKWFYVGVTLLMFVISAALGALSDEQLVGSGIISFVTGILSTVVNWWIYIGMIGILLAAYTGKPLSISQLFEQDGQTLWHYALGTVLYSLIILGGLILLIFPAVIWGIKFNLYSYLVVDRGMKPIEALKESARLTHGHKWTLLGFFILLGLLNLGGALLLFVGLFVTVPVTLLASVWVYKWLAEKVQAAPELAVSEEVQTN